MMPYELNFTDILSRGTYGFFFIALIFLTFLLIISWILLPIAIFKIKSLLTDANSLLKRMTTRLQSIEELLAKQTQMTNAPVKTPETYFAAEESSPIRLKEEK